MRELLARLFSCRPQATATEASPLVSNKVVAMYVRAFELMDALLMHPVVTKLCATALASRHGEWVTHSLQVRFPAPHMPMRCMQAPYATTRLSLFHNIVMGGVAG